MSRPQFSKQRGPALMPARSVLLKLCYEQWLG